MVRLLNQQSNSRIPMGINFPTSNQPQSQARPRDRFLRSLNKMSNPSTIVLLLIVGLLSSCNPRSPKKNQSQNLSSPSGAYSLRIPIEENTTNPKYSGTRVWKVTIS